MAKAIGKDPTQNLFAVLLQQESFDVDPKKLSKNPKKNAPTAVDKTAAVESAPTPVHPTHPPTPAEKEKARKEKEDEKKAVAAAQAAAQAEKQKAKAEAEAGSGKNQPTKMTREQWELQNKQKKHSNTNDNQQDNKQNQGQQNNDDKGWIRPQNQGQRYNQQGGNQQGQYQQGQYQQGQYQQGQYQQGQYQQGQYQQGQYQQGQGNQQGQDGRRGRGGEGRGPRPGREGGFREKGGEGRGEGRGQRGGREGGFREGGRGRGRRSGGDGGQYRPEDNKNREFNQRGQNLSGEPKQRGREHDRKSGKFVKNFSNNNVSDFPKVEQEPENWNLESAPPTETGETWTGPEAENAQTTEVQWDEVNQGTSEATPTATATKEGGKPATEGTAAKEPELPTKSYEEYLKDQEDKRKELQELLEKRKISAPTPRQLKVDKSETGRYVDVKKEAPAEKPPQEEKVKKEPIKDEKKEKKAAKVIPLADTCFKMEPHKDPFRRRERYNNNDNIRDSQEGGSGEAGENQGNEQSNQGGENRGRGRGRRGGGRSGGTGGGNRNARPGRQSNRAFNNNNNNRGNGGNVLPSQANAEDWPALVH